MGRFGKAARDGAEQADQALADKFAKIDAEREKRTLDLIPKGMERDEAMKFIAIAKKETSARLRLIAYGKMAEKVTGTTLRILKSVFL